MSSDQGSALWTAAEYVDLLQGSLDYLQPGIAVYDPEDRLLFCNRRMREIYPEVAHEFKIGTPYAKIARAFYKYRHDKVKELTQDQYVAKRLANHVNPSGVDEEYLNHDGTWLLIWDRKAPNGCIIGFRLDITQRKHAELKVLEIERFAKQELEGKVEERTVELIQTLEHLRGTQEKLIQSEKLASLGPIVAGIAHEINTPLGNAQLVASTLNNRVQVFGQATSGGLTRKALTELLNELETGTQLVTDNLTRAVGLVQQFKNAVVDRSVSKQSSSLLADQIYKIELLLQPVLKCHIQCFTYAVPQSIEMTTDAGALEQVITNLVNNSLIHAFGDKDDGRMHLEATIKGQKVVFIYTDDGRGMDNEVLAKIFDPFFSTRFGQGGSGLGMFVVYNLVTTALAGSIQVESGPGKGFRCTIEIPKTTPAKRSASRSRT
jgi:signal transduction histidine kinase